MKAKIGPPSVGISGIYLFISQSSCCKIVGFVIYLAIFVSLPGFRHPNIAWVHPRANGGEKGILKLILMLAGMMAGMLALYVPSGVHGGNGKPTPVPPATPAYATETGALLAFTDTRENAEHIASLYEIQLERWENRLAVFSTSRNTRNVIAEGEANGWPPLSINHLDRPF